MRFIYWLANILIIIGIVSLLVGLGVKVFAPEGFSWAGLGPGGFLRFADTCILISIALYVKEIVCEKIKKE
ncbi:MAG: hypothetical protein AB1401_10955 [Thermodesulfobacteriota bacterium]